MIEKKCKNYIYDNCSLWEMRCNNCTVNEHSDKEYAFDYFKPYEGLIRKDEKEKIIDALWLSITDDKKIIFEKDGHKFKLNLVPIINSEEE